MPAEIVGLALMWAGLGLLALAAALKAGRQHGGDEFPDDTAALFNRLLNRPPETDP